ncbi:peptidyl-prolyl cis-trans isomerase B (cyclophilin B) [Saccharothrix tamanrassetensis]|uniref:Peptidyl-prolyl cis-trans isomerase B (Cyclophilin B) n=1 Tax=Saccharothrix tamanrassetensis TaxID=1051531 RepID=A0A841CU53_9PSEU|nr:peptidylprolyl isomerase [Saccharothrix tamanrassetensis]MBB5959465.1 peptidyl-prolyl cis-trans isomerase B (cyclophilin B) [Saccharothrix tamanrassetensis]
MPTNVQRREQAKRKLERQLVRRAERAKRRRVLAVVVTAALVVVVAGGVYFLATTDFNSGDDNAAGSSTTPTPVQIPTEVKPLPKRPTPLADPVNCEYRPSKEASAKEGTKAPEAAGASSAGTAAATIKSNIGELKLTLDRSLAPCTVNSFVSLAKQGYFNGTTCHRIGTQGLQMLQCGDPTGSGSGGPGYAFDNETWPELTYGRGYLAMANAGADPETQKGTNGSQFFIVYGDAQLSPDYTVFGSVDEAGLKLIDEVARAGHDGSFDPSPGGGKPNKEVKFEEVTVA